MEDSLMGGLSRVFNKNKTTANCPESGNHHYKEGSCQCFEV
jgi:hypothetical protein